jgi:hypothetical protein
VKKLATRYGIVTPYTSQLILEEGMRLAGKESAFDSSRWNTTVGLGGGAGGGAAARPGARGGRAGAAGPSTPGAAAPASEAKAAEAPGAPAAGATVLSLADLGRARTGAEAVRESLETGSDDFHLGGTRRLGDGADKNAATRRAGLVRNAAGRTFVVIGEEFVEQGLPDDWQKTAVAVEAFSDAYFALLKANPKLREVLALGDRVVFRDGERVVRVGPKVEPAAPKAGEGPTPQGPVVK